MTSWHRLHLNKCFFQLHIPESTHVSLPRRKSGVEISRNLRILEDDHPNICSLRWREIRILRGEFLNLWKLLTKKLVSGTMLRYINIPYCCWTGFSKTGCCSSQHAWVHVVGRARSETWAEILSADVCLRQRGPQGLILDKPRLFLKSWISEVQGIMKDPKQHQQSINAPLINWPFSSFYRLLWTDGYMLEFVHGSDFRWTTFTKAWPVAVRASQLIREKFSFWSWKISMIWTSSSNQTRPSSTSLFGKASATMTYRSRSRCQWLACLTQLDGISRL